MPTPSASEPIVARVIPAQAGIQTKDRARAALTDAIDPASVVRFRADLAAAAGRRIDPADTLAVAVSGGPDSIALLALTAAAFPGQVAAATYDHRVRAGSAAEARAVGRACRALGAPHTVLAPPLKVRVFRHAEARAGRYAALADWGVAGGAALLLTAHHADDQAETLLMRLARGSGIAGLAGIRARREGDPPVVRPLLGWRRHELRALATATGLGFVDDPANADPRFERARIRAFLAGQTALDPAQLARSAAYLGEAEADLAAAAGWLWDAQRRDASSGELHLALAPLPRELQRRLVRRALGDLRGTPLDPAVNVESLLDALAAGRAATQAEVLVRPQGDVWRFAPAPPRRTS